MTQFNCSVICPPPLSSWESVCFNCLNCCCPIFDPTYLFHRMSLLIMYVPVSGDKTLLHCCAAHGHRGKGISITSHVLLNVSLLPGISGPYSCVLGQWWSPCCSLALSGLQRTKLPFAVSVETTHPSVCWPFSWPVTFSYQCWEAWLSSCLE